MCRIYQFLISYYLIFNAPYGLSPDLSISACHFRYCMFFSTPLYFEIFKITTDIDIGTNTPAPELLSQSIFGFLISMKLLIYNICSKARIDVVTVQTKHVTQIINCNIVGTPNILFKLNRFNSIRVTPIVCPCERRSTVF